MAPNGMQGTWTRPALTSPIRPAVLAALPEDGSPIRRRDLITKVREAHPEFTEGAVSGWIQELVHDRSELQRVGYGTYRRAPR